VIKDGEILECYGGPHDGRKCPVTFILAFIDGVGIPNNYWRFGNDWYELDTQAHRWMWRGKKGQAK
jgi:hypothetical protein